MNRLLLLALMIIAILAFLAIPAMPALAEWRRDHREECARLDQKLRDIQQQRRAGYTADKGRNLELQRQKAEEKRRSLCR